MSRIEDQEAERIERVRQEAQAAAKRADAKRIDQDRQFSRYVAQTQQQNAQQQNKDQRNFAQNQNANQMLMAKRGINANQLSGNMIQNRANGNDSQRAQNKAKNQELSQRQNPLLAQSNKSQNLATGNMAVTGRGQSSGQNKQRSRQEDKQGAAAEQEAAGQRAMFALPGQAIAATDGVGARASSNTAGAPGRLLSQEVIDELVARVQQGVDAKAGRNDIGAVRIELKDNVLAGSTLLFEHEEGSGKLSLKITTGDEEVARLLSSNSTAQELGRALKDSKLHLTELEVNGDKVIRS